MKRLPHQKLVRGAVPESTDIVPEAFWTIMSAAKYIMRTGGEFDS
jgi:hypothetical protein